MWQHPHDDLSLSDHHEAKPHDELSLSDHHEAKPHDDLSLSDHHVAKPHDELSLIQHPKDCKLLHLTAADLSRPQWKCAITDCEGCVGTSQSSAPLRGFVS